MALPRNTFLGIVAIQIVDVTIHMLTGQFELLRTLASLVLIIGSYTWFRASTSGSWMDYGMRSWFVYLLLNVYFVMTNGLINPETNSLRIPLFLFVLASSVLPVSHYLESTYE
ncbi:MAG: hypothetical protein ACXAE3_10485 [Candidatus Kariarchaeaceae archaeon]